MAAQARAKSSNFARRLRVLLLRTGRAALVPALAIFTAFVIGAVIIWVTTGSLRTAFEAYAGLLQGALGSPRAIAGTLVRSVPYVFTGLAVALAFKCGLFNIGAEGQLAPRDIRDVLREDQRRLQRERLRSGEDLLDPLLQQQPLTLPAGNDLPDLAAASAAAPAGPQGELSGLRLNEAQAARPNGVLQQRELGIFHGAGCLRFR